VDGRRLVDDWGPHRERVGRGSIELVAGQRYPLVLEYRDLSGAAVIRLLWSGPGTRRAVVPAERLFPGGAGTP
jgi:hypothetical protein